MNDLFIATLVAEKAASDPYEELYLENYGVLFIQELGG